MVQTHDNTNKNAQRKVKEENDCQEKEEEMNDVDSDLCDSSYRFSDDSEEEPIEKLKQIDVWWLYVENPQV